MTIKGCLTTFLLLTGLTITMVEGRDHDRNPDKTRDRSPHSPPPMEPTTAPSLLIKKPPIKTPNPRRAPSTTKPRGSTFGPVAVEEVPPCAQLIITTCLTVSGSMSHGTCPCRNVNAVYFTATFSNPNVVKASIDAFGYGPNLDGTSSNTYVLHSGDYLLTSFPIVCGDNTVTVTGFDNSNTAVCSEVFHFNFVDP